MAKTFEDAAVVVDEMFNVALQNAGCKYYEFHLETDTNIHMTLVLSGDDSGDDSGDEDRREEREDDEADPATNDSPVHFCISVPQPHC